MQFLDTTKFLNYLYCISNVKINILNATFFVHYELNYLRKITKKEVKKHAKLMLQTYILVYLPYNAPKNKKTTNKRSQPLNEERHRYIALDLQIKQVLSTR